MTDAFDQIPQCDGDDSRLTVENLRKKRAFELNSRANSREELQTQYGQVWAPEELAHDFEVVGFAAPYVVVRRKQDQIMGQLGVSAPPSTLFQLSGRTARIKAICPF